MKTADISNLYKYTAHIAIALGCLVACEIANAKREVVVQAETVQKSPELNLNLPADDAIKTEEPAWAIGSLKPIDANDANQLVAGRKKKAPLVDCGMDMYQNTGPDISLTSRLTGECDLKLHY